MAFLFVAYCAVITAAIFYWYRKRNQSYVNFRRDIRMGLHMHAVGAASLLDDYIQGYTKPIPMPNMSGKIVVITGGGRGIGAEIVKELLKCNATVIVGMRNPDAIKTIIPNDEKTNNLTTFKLDLGSLHSVKKFAEEVKSKYSKINLLICNGGIMYVDYALTEDGFESQFAVNYLSHFYLTHLLLQHLKAGGSSEEPSRVINVSSSAHYPARMYFEDINMKNGYNSTAAYAHSKLAQIMSARYVDKLMKDGGYPVELYSVHPGIVNTSLFEHTFFSYVPFIMKIFFKTPAQGALPILYACTSDSLKNKGGLYISNGKEGYSNSLSKNFHHQFSLHVNSCQMVGIDPKDFGRV